jgi:hypothetical protein
MKRVGFLFLVATLFLGGCILKQREAAPNLIAESSSPSPELFSTPMRAGFLIDLRGKEQWITDPDFQFKNERVYLTPKAKNVVFFRAGDVTWGEFFETVGVKVEGNCVTVQGEQTCTAEGERLEVVINSEAKPYDPTWPMHSGDRVFIGIEKDAVGREVLAKVPDPWTVEE